MRLQRGVSAAGVEPELARAIARACRCTPARAVGIAYHVHLEVAEVLPLVESLERAGFLDGEDATYAGERVRDWETTIAGDALAMATFGRSMSRAAADRLLKGAVRRAMEYNADETKPYLVRELVVFGSYLDEQVRELGDLDLAVSCVPRRHDGDLSGTLRSYGEASGKRFPTLFAALDWARTELFATLRQRSAYVNVHDQDIREITDQWRVVYSLEV